MINNEKIKRIGFVLIGIANFILLPFILMYFSGKMTLVWNFITFLR